LITINWKNCEARTSTKKADGTYMYKGKTQRYFKKQKGEHFCDVWKVIETGRKKFGPNWKGSGRYTQADAFAIHCAQHCCDPRNSNDVRAMLKEIIIVSTIIIIIIVMAAFGSMWLRS
jgi:hypothetical protein